MRLRTQPDRTGRVCDGPTKIGGRCYFGVEFDGEVDQFSADNLEPLRHEGTDLRSQLLNGTWGGRETLSRLVTFTKLDQPLRDVLYSFRSTRTRFEAYQFKPLIKFLESPSQRLLIADEVGLGKTIEAGYILRELKARQPTSCRRVLVVCPSALREKWRSEMERRFDEAFDILDSAGVRQKIIQAWERQGERCSFHAICSMQTLRGRRAAKRLAGGDGFSADWQLDAQARRTLLDDFDDGVPQLDLVIIDEAHHMRNPGSLVHRLGHVLSEKADSLILMTATPIHRGEQDLFELLRVLDPQEFDVYTSFVNRTRANEFIVQAERELRARIPADFDRVLAPLRQLRDEPYLSTLVNRELLDEVIDRIPRMDPSRRDHLIELQFDLNQINLLAHSVTRTRKRDIQEEKPIRTPAVIRPKWTAEESSFYEAVSDACHSAYQTYSGDFAARFAVQQLQRQLASCMPATVHRYREMIAEADTEDGDEADDEPTSRQVIRDPDFQNVFDEHKDLIRQTDSKFDAFQEALRKLDREQPGRKLVVFSFFKSTLSYLNRRLTEIGITCTLISGDVPSRPNDPDRDERGKRVRAFHENPDLRVLLSSEVGSEGLDFQTAAYIVVNYDLPWNPMVVEQRIGRLDRYGQPSKRIIIWNFSMSDTIEDRILERLYDRIGIFEKTIGDLEPILGEAIEAIERIVTDGKLSDGEKESMANQTLDAVEQRRKHLEELESESSTFVSRDEYFIEQVNAVTERRRYLTPEELKTFVGDFLERKRLQWNVSEQEGVFELTWCRPLADLIERRLSMNERVEVRFRTQPFGRRIECTFDHERAYNSPHLELLTVRHPLVRAIFEEIKSNRDMLHPVSALSVSGRGLKLGEFFYQIYLLKQSAAVREGRFLNAVFLSQDGAVLDQPASEDLLFALTTRGQKWDDPPSLDAETVDELTRFANEELVVRKDRQEEELNRQNQLMCERQLNSLKSSFDAKCRKLNARLEAAISREQQPRYIRMIEGQLRNLEIDFESKTRDVELRREIHISFRPIGAGFVRVTS